MCCCLVSEKHVHIAHIQAGSQRASAEVQLNFVTASRVSAPAWYKPLVRNLSGTGSELHFDQLRAQSN